MRYVPYKQCHENGYIALLSTIIIGALLLVMTVEAGQRGWTTRFMVLGSETKLQSQTLAFGCAEQALALFLVDLTWPGDATSTAELGTCYVFPLEKNTPKVGLITVRVQAVVSDRFTNLITVYEVEDIYQDATPRAVSEILPITTPNFSTRRVSSLEVAVMP